MSSANNKDTVKISFKDRKIYIWGKTQRPPCFQYARRMLRDTY